jgi:hypothetical protein
MILIIGAFTWFIKILPIIPPSGILIIPSIVAFIISILGVVEEVVKIDDIIIRLYRGGPPIPMADRDTIIAIGKRITRYRII